MARYLSTCAAVKKPGMARVLRLIQPLPAGLFQSGRLGVTQELALIEDLVALDGDDPDLGLGIPKRRIGRNVEPILYKDLDRNNYRFRRLDLVAPAQIGWRHRLSVDIDARLIFDARSLPIFDQLGAILPGDGNIRLCWQCPGEAGKNDRQRVNNRESAAMEHRDGFDRVEGPVRHASSLAA